MHLTELFAEYDPVSLSRSTVRRILAKAGIKSPRSEGHLGIGVGESGRRREECLCRWLETRGPKLCRHATIGNGSGEIHGATFPSTGGMPLAI